MPEEAGENFKVSECAQGSTNFEASENFLSKASHDTFSNFSPKLRDTKNILRV